MSSQSKFLPTQAHIVRVLIAFALLLASSALTLVAPIQPSLSSTNYVVYSDALASGWQDWSWGGTYDLAHTGTVQSGSAAISATITSGYGGLSLRVDPGLPGSSYSAVQFWVHGGSSGTRQLQLVIEEGDSGPRTTPAHFDANAGSWTLVTIPLSALGNPATIKRINIEDRTGSGQPTFYVDEIILIAGSSATPTPTPLPPPPNCPTPVYLDGLAPGWQNWSWGGSYDFAHSGTVHSGSQAIEVNMGPGYAGLSFRVDPGLPGASYTAVTFWVHGGASGTRQLQLFIQQADSGGDTAAVPFDAPAGVWTQVTIPLFALGNPATIKRINIQDRTGSGQPTFYVDTVCLSDVPVSTPTPTPTPLPPPPNCPTPVYLDGLAPGWQNWSWGGSYDFAHSGTVHSGSQAIEVNMGPGYAGLSFRVDPGLPGASYTAVTFWVHGGASGTRQLQLFIQQADSGGDTAAVPFDAPAGVWTQVTIPLFALGNPATIKRINIQDRTGNGQPTFYVDTVCLSDVPVSTPTPTPTPLPPPPNCPTPVYLDGLAPGWQNWSWGGSYDFAHSGTVHSGSQAIEVNMGPGYAGLSFRVDPGLPGASYTAVTFWVHGGASGTRQLQLFIQQADSGGDTAAVPFDAPAGVWTQVTIPLFALGNPATIKRINIQDRTGNGQPTFYVDTVCLSNAPVPTPTPPPPPPPPGPPPPPPGPPAPRLPGVPGCTYTLYDDALASGWEDWSWDTNVAREHPYALSGRSLAFRYRAGYAGLSLRSPVALNRNDYDAVVFWITGGDLPWTNSTSDPGVRQIMFLLQSTDTGGESRRFHIDAPIKTWMPVTIPLALLGELTAIKRVNFQERTGQPQLPVFVDNICFVRGEFDLSGLAARAPGDVLLFDETTSEDYENWSWDTAISFANTAPAVGLRSIKVQHQKGYAGFSLRLKVGLNAANFGGITFRVHGGEQGRRQLDFLIQQTDDGGESRRVSFDVPAGQWYEVAIPLSALGDIKTIKRINIQDRSGKPQTYYLDNLLIVQRAVSLTLPVAAPSRRTTTQTATRPTGTARRSDILFDDALAAGWENWSWNTRADFANAQPALGRRSIAVRYNEGYAGLSLRSPVTLSAADYGGIAFWVHGGEHDHELRLFVQQSDTGGDSRGVPFEARAGVWTPITVPISFLGELRTLKRINIQDISGAPKGAFYVDAIRLVRGPITTTLTLPRTGPTQEGGYVIYSDMLAEGWENWSWNTQVNLGSREPVLIGSRSIEAQTKPGGGLSLRSPITLDGRSYGGIVFRIYGGETRARRLQLFLHLSDESGTETPSFIFDVAPRRWLTFNVPLSQLGNPATIKRVNFQDLSGASQTTFYVDEIELIPAREAPPPPQTPFEAIFGNILARGWRNASEGARVSFNNDRIARTMYAIAVQPQRAGAQFKLEARQPVSTSAFVALSFWVHGGEQGVNGLQALLYPASSDEPIVVSFDAPSNQWREIVIQLDAVSAIQAFAIRVPDDKASATFYVDDIRLLRKTGTP